MNCSESLDRISAALDGELNPEQRRALDEHLNHCPKCSALFESLAAQSAAMRSLDCQMPADLTGQIMRSLPSQDAPKKSTVLQWKRWVSLAACFIAVVAIAAALPYGLSSSKMSVMNGAAAPEAPREAAMPEMVSYGSSESEAPACDEPGANTESTKSYDCAFIGKVHNIRVPYNSDTAYPVIRVLNSMNALTDYVSQISEVASGDLNQLLDTYDDAFFDSLHLLTILVEETSGSNRVELVEVSPDYITLKRFVPEVYTDDMAAWLMVVEVDSAFAASDHLTISYLE